MNYITDRNSFSLPQPPEWWLTGMKAFDPDLVLMPSRFRAVHMLTRRVKYSRGVAPLFPGHTPDVDSQMFIQYGVVPVSWVDCHNWTMGALTGMLDNLRARDTWHIEGPFDEEAMKRAAFEGGTKVTRLVDEQDTTREAKISAQNHENAWNATGEAWRYKQAVSGERILGAGMPKNDEPATVTPSAT